MKNIDNEGYILLENDFESKGYKFVKVQDLKNNWMIYKKSPVSYSGPEKFELIRAKKQEEFNFRGTIIPKKWKYPTDNEFGSRGFDCASLAAAIERYNQIVSDKQEKEHDADRKLNIPVNKKFTIKDVIDNPANKGWTDNKVRLKIQSLLDEGKLKVAGEKVNKKGKNSKYYIYEKRK